MKIKKIFLLTLCVCFLGVAYSQNEVKKEEGTKTEKASKASKQLEPIQLTQEEFIKKVFDYNDTTMIYKGKKPAIVDFYADWCGPCKRLAPILDQLLKEYEGNFIVYKVNVDQNKDLSRALQVRNIPTMLFLLPKEKPQRTVGLLSKEQIKEIIDEYLLKSKN